MIIDCKVNVIIFTKTNHKKTGYIVIYFIFQLKKKKFYLLLLRHYQNFESISFFFENILSCFKGAFYLILIFSFFAAKLQCFVYKRKRFISKEF